jgi:hypothetical protein
LVANRVDYLKFIERGVVNREIDPIHHRKSLVRVVLHMNNLRMFPRNEGKGTPCAHDIHGLPQAVQNEHWLFKRRFHLRPFG